MAAISKSGGCSFDNLRKMKNNSNFFSKILSRKNYMRTIAKFRSLFFKNLPFKPNYYFTHFMYILCIYIFIKPFKKPACINLYKYLKLYVVMKKRVSGYSILIILIILIAVFFILGYINNFSLTGHTVNIENGLYAHYKLDGNADDELRVHNGTITGNVQYITDGAKRAALFDGNKSYIIIGTGAEFSDVCNNGCTVCAWAQFKDLNTSNNEGIVGRYGSGSANDRFLLLYMHGTQQTVDFLISENGSNPVRGTLIPIVQYNILPSTWYHFCGVYNGNTTTLGTNTFYLNGVLAEVSPLSQSTQINATAWADNEKTFIGKYDEASSATNYMNGSIGDVRLYSKALGDEEIREIYLSTWGTLPCIPTWASVNTSCTAEETLTKWYYDINNCNNNAERPGNETLSCAYSSIGSRIIGNMSMISVSNIEPSLYIDSSEVNFSYNYNSLSIIEFFDEDAISRIRFQFNFNTSTLDLGVISIYKQPPTSVFGYLIVNGISASKRMQIDKLNSSSNSVCVRNSYVSSITQISNSCNNTGEYKIYCPGTNSGFTCNISTSRDLFIVSGLTNSGVREIVSGLPDPVPCSPTWACTNWTACISGRQTRNCTDLEYCGEDTGKPSENISCGQTPVTPIVNQSTNPTTCTPNKQCGAWTPSTCPKNETQTRTCTDTNGCTTFPNETQGCTYKKGISIWVVFLIIFFIIIAIIVLTILIIRTVKKSKEASQNTPISSSQNPKRPFSPPGVPPLFPKKEVTPYKPL